MASLVTIEQARAQVSLGSDETWHDALLSQLMAAADAYICRRLGCTLVATQTELDAMAQAPEKAIVVADSPDLSLAALLLIAHWFANRESASDRELTEVPHGVEALLFPFRDLAIG